MDTNEIMAMVENILSQTQHHKTTSEQLEPTVTFAINICVFHLTLLQSGVSEDLAKDMTMVYLENIIKSLKW